MRADPLSLSIKASLRPILKRLLLAIVFILSVLRLVDYSADITLNGLQIDFSAFYTAGEALNYGLSPYDNNIKHSPPIWDGINDYQHSRFLYPPLVANLFQPIALIPYSYAKILWGIFTLLCITLALYIASNILAIDKPDQVFLLGITVCWYYPLLTHLERGQIDAVTLLLLTIAVYYMARKDRKQERLSGIFLAAAALLKLHSIYMLPFLIARKYWRALQGFGIAISVISIASVATPSARMLLRDYLANEMPRIADYGQPDHGDLLLDADVIQAVIMDLPSGYTIKDGHRYQPVSFNFVSNATLVRPIHDRLDLSGVNFNFAALSFAMFGIFFLMLLIWQYFFFPIEGTSPEKEFLYWQAILILILLSAPLTHVMNTVWMLPVVMAAIASHKNVSKVPQKLGYGLMVSGIILTGMPDTLYLDLLSLFTSHLINDKYLIGEAFVLIGSLLYLSELTSPHFRRLVLLSQRISKRTARQN